MDQEKLNNIMTQPTLAEQLPYEFKNGFRLRTVKGACCRCEKELSAEFLRGELTTANEHVVSFEGHGVCLDCRVVTRTAFRYSDDGFFMNRSGEQGVWEKKEQSSTRNSAKIITRIRNIIKGT
jgi:hypothetical protein